MRARSKSLVAQVKRRIQQLVRKIVILRDGGCVLRGLEFGPCTSSFTKDGHLVLQADHLVSRGKNIGFADTRLIVCLCEGHHTKKTFAWKKQIEAKYRELIGRERTALWDRAEADTKSYPMGLWEWEKVELGLKEELKKYE